MEELLSKTNYICKPILGLKINCKLFLGTSPFYFTLTHKNTDNFVNEKYPLPATNNTLALNLFLTELNL